MTETELIVAVVVALAAIVMGLALIWGQVVVFAAAAATVMVLGLVWERLDT